MKIDIAGMLLTAIFKDIGVLWASITASPSTLLILTGMVILIVVANFIAPTSRRARSRSSYRR